MSESFPGELALLAELYDRYLRGRTSMAVDTRKCAALAVEGLIESVTVRAMPTFRLTINGEARLAALKLESGI